jgi:hypothetical protein
MKGSGLTFQIDVWADDRHLEIWWAGPWQLAAAKHAIETVQTEAENRGYDKVLLDVRGLLASGEFRGTDNFFVGVYAATTWAWQLKVAVVYRAAYLDKLTEDAAVNRGAHLAVFLDREIALRWLLAELPNGVS